MAFLIGLVAVVILLFLVVLVRPKKSAPQLPETARQQGLVARRHEATMRLQASVSLPKRDSRDPEIRGAEQELRLAKAEVVEKQALVTQAQVRLDQALARVTAAQERLVAISKRADQARPNAGPGGSGKRPTS
jgi:hypothetical protein